MNYRAFPALFNTLLLIVLIVLLSGCASTQPVAVQYRTLYQAIPAQLTARVQPERPTDRLSYLAMPIYEREVYLTQYSVQLMKNLHSCNAQLDGIAELTQKWKVLNDSQP